MASLDDLLASIAQKYDVPLPIARGVFGAESSYGTDPRRLTAGPAGELGDMQLTPAIVKQYGVQDPLNDQQNLDAGVHYLHDLYTNNGDDWFNALARYNGSRQYAADIMARAGMPIPAGVAGQVGLGGGGLDQFLRDYQSQLDPLVQQQQKEIQTALAGNTQLQDANRRVQGQYDEIAKQQAANVQPQAPKPPQLEEAPQHPQDDPARVFGQFMPMQAAFGGLFLRNNAGASLNAASAAMKAANEGDDRAFQQAHDQWLDHTKKALDAYQLQRDAYQDALKGWETNNEALRQKAEMIARSYGNDVALQAIIENRPKILGDAISGMEHSAQPILEMYNRATQQDIEREHNRIIEEGHSPVVQGYNAAKQRVLDAGGTPEEAEKAGDQAAARAQLAIKSGPASVQAGQSFLRRYQADDSVKMINKSKMFYNIIDNIDEKNIGEGQGQLRLLDAFTKSATGGQAIRQFMVSAAQSESTKAQQFANEFNKYVGADGQLHIFSDTVAKEFLKGAKEIVAEQRDYQDEVAAKYANISQNEGIHPELWLDPDEYSRIQEKGLFKFDPKKIVYQNPGAMTNEDTDESGAAIPPPPAPPKNPNAPKPLPLPKSEKELKTGSTYQTSRGAAVWKGNHFEAASNG